MKIDAYSGRDAQMILSYLMQCESEDIGISEASKILEKLITEKALKHKMSEEQKNNAKLKQNDKRLRAIAEKIKDTSITTGDRCPECGSRRWVTATDIQQQVIWTECKKCGYSKLREEGL